MPILHELPIHQRLDQDLRKLPLPAATCKQTIVLIPEASTTSQEGAQRYQSTEDWQRIYCCGHVLTE